jgi:hypothetical protein
MTIPTESAAAVIRRLLRLSDKVVAALMPHGEDSPQHHVGGYLTDSGKSETDEMLDRDNQGWDIIG